MSQAPRVKLDIEDSIAFVSLNRADKHNGLDQEMMKSLVDTAKKIQKNRKIRVVILKATGSSFCAGLDFSYVSKNPIIIPKYFVKLPWSRDNMFQRVSNVWRNISVPVIAVVHGNCFGGGVQLMLGCDFRIVDSKTQFSIMEMKWGLIPDMSGMVNLSRLTREDIAKELCMTGRVFSAKEAHDYGLVTKVCDAPEEEAIRLANLIARQSPDAVSAAKYLIQKTWTLNERRSLLWERVTQLRLLGRKNQRIAMKNGLSKSDTKQPFLDRTTFK
jgi:enoyl-CoA hydratase/carnithine racemase